MVTQTAPPRFAIRDFRSSDEAVVLSLLNLTLGTGRAFERSAAFFRWKHLDNPFGTSLMLLADAERIIGLRAFMRWQFRAGQSTLAAVRAVDTATHPEYQRMGIFSRLTNVCVERARADGVHLIFNTPNRYSLPGYLKLGWTYVGRATIFARPLRPHRIIGALLGPRLGMTPNGAPDQESDAGGRWCSIDELLTHEAGMARLLARDDTMLASGIRTARSVGFLRWRYAQVPSLRYGAHWIGEGAPRAAVIFRLTRRRGMQELMLCELLMESEQDGRHLLRELLREIRADYAIAHSAWGAPHRRVLLSTGFIPVPRGPHYTVRPLTADLGIEPTAFAAWRLGLGDLEVF